jgi:hypothetical protein
MTYSLAHANQWTCFFDPSDAPITRSTHNQALATCASPFAYVKLATSTMFTYVTSLLICFQDILKYMGKVRRLL